MAKEFKQFDRKYAKSAGGCLHWLRDTHGVEIRQDVIDDLEGWAYSSSFTEEYSIATIRDAVYFAEGVEEWQQFRVSMKGLSTKEKIYCLEWWYLNRVQFVSKSETRRLNLIRVNNYLGALKRGGQLNSELQIVK